MIDDALAPGAAKGGILAAREDDGIFDRNAALVVIAVQGPGLQLPTAEAAFVHEQMEGMAMVIAVSADFAEGCAQLFQCPAHLEGAAFKDGAAHVFARVGQGQADEAAAGCRV